MLHPIITSSTKNQQRSYHVLRLNSWSLIGNPFLSWKLLTHPWNKYSVVPWSGWDWASWVPKEADAHHLHSHTGNNSLDSHIAGTSSRLVIGYFASSLTKQNLWCITSNVNLPGARVSEYHLYLHEDKLFQSTAQVYTHSTPNLTCKDPSSEGVDNSGGKREHSFYQFWLSLQGCQWSIWLISVMADVFLRGNQIKGLLFYFMQGLPRNIRR